MIDSAEFWEQRYKDGSTGWDIGGPSPALVRYVQERVSKDARILIPGAGYAHEAAQLWTEGYDNLYVCDWSASAFEALRERFPSRDHLMLQADFFALTSGYDLILEQTFFCALPPARRGDYVMKVHELLYEGGCLVGLFFDREFPEEGPPFGGSAREYQALFSRFFKVLRLSPNRHAIKPREGTELFGVFRKDDASTADQGKE